MPPNSGNSPPGSGPSGRSPRFFYGWYIVGSVWVTFFLNSAGNVGIFFKPILEEFHLDRATLSLVFTGAMLVSAAGTPFIGRLIDRFGPRVMLMVSLAAQTASYVIYGLAANVAHVFTGRLLGEIKALQAGQVVINRWFYRLRGRAQAISSTGYPLGTLILSPVSQALILAIGWRQTYFFWAGLTFVIVLPLTLLVRTSPGVKGLRPDGSEEDESFALKLSEEKHTGVAAPETGHTLGKASGMASFWLLNGAHFICGIGCGFIGTHIVIFTTDMGYSEMVGASLLSVQGGLNLLGVLLAGHLADKYARHKVLSLTHVIRSVSFFVAVVFIMTGGGSLWVLYLAMVLFGLGWFTTSPLTSGCVADYFGNFRMGTIISIVLSSHTLGMAVGAYGGGLTYALTGSYNTFFLAQGVLELIAAGLAFAIRGARIKAY